MLANALYAQKSGAIEEVEQRVKKAEALSPKPDSVLSLLRNMDHEGLDDSLVIEIDRLKGIAHYKKGHSDSALVYLTAASVLLDSFACTEQHFQVNNALAAILQVNGLTREAVDYYLRALHCAEKRNDSLSKAKIFNNLAVLYREHGAYEEAGRFCRQAIGIYRAKGDADGLGGALNSMGQVHLALNRLDSALLYFQQSITLKQGSADKRGLANSLNNIGYVHALYGQFEEAISYYEQAAAIREEQGDLYGQASIHVNIAGLFTQQGGYQLAQRHVALADSLNLIVHSPEIQGRIWTTRAKIYEKTGDFRQAYEAMLRFNDVREKALSDSNLKNVARVQYAAALEEARNEMRRAEISQKESEGIIHRQRMINLLLAIGLAIFIGLVSLLFYQLRLLTNLRNQLTRERDNAKQQAENRKRALRQVAHEIRTPIQGIVTLTEFLEMEEDINEARQLAQVVHQSSNRLLDIIHNVLNFARLEEGKLEFNQSTFSITASLNEMVALLEVRARAKGLTLVKQYEDLGEITCQSDPIVFHQIMTNLVGNAIKYTSEGTITIGASREDSGIAIWVTDTGKGIRAEHQHDIFKPFFQVGDVSVEGAGLGLPISLMYAKALMGDITVSSEPNVGSTFTLWLPCEGIT